MASASVHRRHQLQQLQMPFEHQSAEVDETLKPSERPKDRALRLAIAKAETVKKLFPETIVIGSDQVCACGDTVFRKPKSRDNNIQHLIAFSGQAVFFFTAVCVLGNDKKYYHGINETRVQFRDLSEAEIIRYVDKEQAYDCAGGFKMEQMGLSLMTSVHSDDPSALMGLPLIQLCAFLRELGVEIP